MECDGKTGRRQGAGGHIRQLTSVTGRGCCPDVKSPALPVRWNSPPPPGQNPKGGLPILATGGKTEPTGEISPEGDGHRSATVS